MSDPATLHAILHGLLRLSRSVAQLEGVWRDNRDVFARIKAEAPDLHDNLIAYGARRKAELQRKAA